VRLYGGDSFCQVLAQILKLQLTSPPDGWLATLDEIWLRRKLFLTTLDEIQTFPCFAKPVVPKQFSAQIYKERKQLEAHCQGLPGETPVFTGEVVEIEAEARGFFLEGQLQSFSVYEGVGSPELYLRSLQCLPQPATCVIDVAHLRGRGWAVLEANATWGAGLNGCDPRAVIPCLLAAVQGF